MKRFFQTLLVLFLLVGLVGFARANTLRVERVQGRLVQKIGTKTITVHIPTEGDKLKFEVYNALATLDLWFWLKINGKPMRVRYLIKVIKADKKFYFKLLKGGNKKGFSYLPFPDDNKITKIDFGYGKTPYARVKVVEKKVEVTFFKIKGKGKPLKQALA